MLVPSDFNDQETDVSRGRGGGGTRLHAMISVDGVVTTALLPESGEVTIGRSSSCDVVIKHASVSRHHATLRLTPLEIVDEASRNGTRVHSKTVPPGVYASLAAGDAIQVGEATILIQTAQLTFDGKPMVDVNEREAQPLDVECARSARTGSPFALVVIASETARPKELVAKLRAFMRTSDVVKLDGIGCQVVLTDTGGQHVETAVARLDQQLTRQGIAAQLGVARYPDDGVVPEQLIAHAYEQLERGPHAAPAMDDLREMIRQVATGDLSVLITGETGVGKELCAEMIHRMSQRATRPFVKLNCSALVESLIESELFGHERGAFTGATSAHPGLLELGNTGTVFLDEIGELPLGVQAKLLRVLEERLVRRVGASAGRKVDVRFICATNRDLGEEVMAGRFRRDLYYRINGVTIDIPPLRERRSEIVPLARAFAGRTRPDSPIVLGKEVVAALEHHAWPGNIRELRNTIERAVLLSSGGTLRPSHLVLEPVRDSRESRPSLRDSYPSYRDSQPTMPVERVSSDAIERPPIRPSNQSLASEVGDLERQRILEALEQTGGNQSRAAKLLGISRNTLLSRLDEYGVPRPRK